MAKVLGIGNALVDIMTQLDHDGHLEAFELPKGSMILVDLEKSNKVSAGTDHLEKTMSSGGSAANTIHGLARLGIETAFIGTVGKDELGDFFSSDLEKNNIVPKLFISETHSGRAMALISPDSERTFATHLGAAVELSKEDIKTHHFSGYDYFYIEGYLVQNHDLIEAAVRVAKENGLIVALDLASYNVVEENRDFLEMIIRKYVDIVFANEEEAKAITGKEPEGALNELAESCDIAVVKTGSKGSLIKTGGETTAVEPIRARPVDTTGAGDLYAAGFLYGMVNNLDMECCGRIGSILAGNVIEVIGAKMDNERWERVKEIVAELNRG